MTDLSYELQVNEGKSYAAEVYVKPNGTKELVITKNTTTVDMFSPEFKIPLMTKIPLHEDTPYIIQIMEMAMRDLGINQPDTVTSVSDPVVPVTEPVVVSSTAPTTVPTTELTVGPQAEPVLVPELDSSTASTTAEAQDDEEFVMRAEWFSE